MLEVFYVAPRCYTGSDRYYELLSLYVPGTNICRLSNIYAFFPPLLFFWRFFSRDFFNARTIHTNCENGIYLWSFNKKIIITLHHDVFNPAFFSQISFFKQVFYSIFTRFVYYLSMRIAYKIIFINQDDYKRYSCKEWVYKKSSYICNGINLDELNGIKGDFFKSSIHQKRVLFIGKKNIRKGWDVVQNLFQLKDTANLSFYCTSMLGDKVESNFFTDFGTLPRKQLLTLIKSVDVVFLPSRIEGYSYTIAEALSLGTPVLTRQDWGGFSDIFPGLIGFFSSSDRPEKIINKLILISNSKDMNCIFPLEKVDMSKTAQQYIHLYRQ